MDDDLPILDAHLHLWDPITQDIPWLRSPTPIAFRYGNYDSIRRPYDVADYRHDARGHRVVKGVYVEVEWSPADPLGETRWIDDVIARHGFPNAVIAQAWFDREDIVDVLAGQARSQLVRGIRHKPRSVLQREDARRGLAGSMDDPRWRDGYAGLARHAMHFELQTPWWHLDAAAELARDFPAIPIVLNHTGLPTDRSANGLAAWRSAMSRLAREPNAFVKISGLGQRGSPWTVAANAPVIRDAIAIFDWRRCMFASNFPVDSLCADFDTIFNGFKQATRDLPEEQRHALFHGNAARVYRLS
jgi:predicted TIM-barrel fold metal-dependent hydrolase